MLKKVYLRPFKELLQQYVYSSTLCINIFILLERIKTFTQIKFSQGLFSTLPVIFLSLLSGLLFKRLLSNNQNRTLNAFSIDLIRFGDYHLHALQDLYQSLRIKTDQPKIY